MPAGEGDLERPSAESADRGPRRGPGWPTRPGVRPDRRPAPRARRPCRPVAPSPARPGLDSPPDGSGVDRPVGPRRSPPSGWPPGRARRRGPDRPRGARPPARRRDSCRVPASAATMGRIPGTGRTSPPSDSSPMNAQRPLARTCSEPSRIPSAIARSSPAPALRTSAGARLTVIRRGGKARPLFRIAPRTRSRASWRAVSGRPTMVKPGSPGATSTSTRITRPSMP